MKRTIAIVLTLLLVLSACRSLPDAEDSSAPEPPEASVTLSETQESLAEQPEKIVIPVSVENRTENTTLQAVLTRSFYATHSNHLFKALLPGQSAETNWQPFDEYDNAFWFQFVDGVAGTNVKFKLEECRQVTLQLEQTDALRLTLTAFYSQAEPVVYSLRYNAQRDLWHLEEAGAVLYSAYLSAVTAREMNPAFPERLDHNQECLAFFTYEPLTDLRFWLRHKGRLDIDPPYGSWELEQQGEFDKLQPGDAVAVAVYDSDYTDSFVSYRDADGIEQACQISFYYQYGTPRVGTPAGYTAPLSAKEWAVVRKDPIPYEKEFSLQLSNHTEQILERICARIGDEQFPLLETLAPGESAQVQWIYTGPAFLWDNEKWAPVFTAQQYGQETVIDRLQLFSEDVRDEYDFTTDSMAFFSSADGSLFCSPQEDYLQRSTDDGERVRLATYQYLPQVRRWIERMTPGQMLYGVGLDYDGGREFRYLFPERDADYPTHGCICVMIATGDILLHDVAMATSEDGSYSWAEQTRSPTETLYTAKDSTLFGLDHVRGPYYYFRYRGTDGSIVRQSVQDQMRDGNNGGVSNSLIVNGEYYHLEEIG